MNLRYVRFTNTWWTAEKHACRRSSRRDAAHIGDTWVLPASRTPAAPCDRTTMSKWFRRAIVLAGVSVPPRTGYHSLRRKFATELKHIPLPDLCALGGWKDAKTILTCYQSPDEGTMRAALADRIHRSQRPLNGHPMDT